MTEFEIATLEISRTGLWISAVHAFISLIVGFGQCALIWYGLRLMQRGTERREEQSQRLHEESKRWHEQTMAALDARHRESMRALEALIERTSK